ncbi:MAG: type IV pilus assembly protein PilM [Candidatus Vogelbacteria bacterium]|nr:type IV pilus assembly protein PilM [Candidatus Vogelbacteria bacterium]
MKSDLFFKFFPVPKYLARVAVGFDISDYSVKFLELLPDQENIKLGRYGERALPAEVVVNGVIKNPTELVKVLASIKAENNFNYAYASLPEDKAFTFRLSLPPMKNEEIRNSIELQIGDFVPIPAPDCVFDYEIVGQGADGGVNVSVSALPKDIVEGYLSVFKNAGFELIGAEVEAQAIARSLLSPADIGAYMIIDIGKIHTSFIVSCLGSVVFTSIINVGGEDITKFIEKNLGLSYDEAVKQKEKKGLLRSAENNDLFMSLIPVVSAMKDEINQRLSFWQEHNTEGSGGECRTIDKIILCGGQASLAGLREYLEIGLGLPVELGNPWVNICPTGDCVMPIKLNESLRYVTCLGLALRNFNF